MADTNARITSGWYWRLTADESAPWHGPRLSEDAAKQDAVEAGYSLNDCVEVALFVDQDVLELPKAPARSAPSASQSTLRQKFERIIDVAYGGVHHLPVRGGGVRERNGLIECSVTQGLATHDFDNLTRLVVACHDECVRMEIRSSGPRLLKLCFWDRKGREGNVWERHPTMEQAIERIRGGRR